MIRVFEQQEELAECRPPAVFKMSQKVIDLPILVKIKLL